MKYVHKRSDGRWEYRPQTATGRVSIYADTLKKLLYKKKQYLLGNKRDLILLECKKYNVRSKKPRVIDYATNWFHTYKEPFVGKSSADMYRLCLKYFQNLTMEIDLAKTDDLQKSINQIVGKPRVKDYAVLFLKQVFKQALQEDLVTKDVSQFLKKGKVVEKKGRSLTLAEQKTLLAHLDECKIGKLILFYLLTGCRRAEALTVKREDINFEKNVIEIKGTKTTGSKRYVIISEKLKNILAESYDEMFSFEHDYVGRCFKDYIVKIGIDSSLTLHSLRHTFSTNLYYLGVPDKQRQAYLGHASIIMTNDIYTHLDPTITRNDIISLYGDLYPF